MTPYILIRGGGDLASGVALRLQHVGLRVLIVEMPQPLCVRRSVSFAQAVYAQQVKIEDVSGLLIKSSSEIKSVWGQGAIPVLVDPDLEIMSRFQPLVLVDARMRKRYIQQDLQAAQMVIGLGPGFRVGENCHAAIETNRGHFLGRVYWEGEPEADTGVPGKVQSYTRERVLHAPVAGVVETTTAIGDLVKEGQPVLAIAREVVRAPFDGVLRGLIYPGIRVREGMKVGDVDPRPETFRCWFVSEKSLAIGGGVLEALLTRQAIRNQLWM